MEYIEAKFEDLLADGDPRLQAGSFDCIFSRMMMAVARDWPTYIAQAASLLAPGGYLELQEIAGFVHYSAASPASPNNRVDGAWKWPQALQDLALARGVDFMGVTNLPTYMEAAGLGKVSAVDYP